MLTRSVDMEWRPRGVLCFSIAPGVVDTGMQQQIRDSGINPVSRIPRAALAPAEEPAKAIGWLVAEGTEDLAGRELDVRDPALRAAAGLPPLPEKKG
jgi:NAD(P)-dependent dehydrogenase (short-subunit alcohol dehydrogenase family)